MSKKPSFHEQHKQKTKNNKKRQTDNKSNHKPKQPKQKTKQNKQKTTTTGMTGFQFIGGLVQEATTLCHLILVWPQQEKHQTEKKEHRHTQGHTRR